MAHDENQYELEDLVQHEGADDGSDIDDEVRPRSAIWTAHEEQSVVRKLDTSLVIFLAILYMLSFLDRSNIGNARIAGLTTDLDLSSNQYEWLLSIFYIMYISFEWTTLLYRVFPAHVYISLCVLAWGLVACLQSVAAGFWSMFVLRALLGIAEAAFGPGVPFFLSGFYKREELALRVGLFISAAPLATSCASSLAWIITKFGAKVPIAPWRLLFLLEGAPSLAVAVIAYWRIPDSPGTARFLNPYERNIAISRLQKSSSKKQQIEEVPGLSLHEIWATLRDPKCYLTAAMFFSCNVAFSSLPPFLPKIINEMNYSTLMSQALSAPPYLVAFVVVVLTAYLSDKWQSRAYLILAQCLLGAAGYIWIAISGLLQAPPFLRYLGVFPAATGFFSAITLIITWTINNQTTATGRGTGVAMLNVIGQLGPLLGTRLYPDSDAPYYVKGMTVCGGFMGAAGVLAVALAFKLARDNKRNEGQGFRYIV